MSNNMIKLHQHLQALYQAQEKHLKEHYQRSLSFQDGLFDRFERACSLGFEEGASIYNSALVFGDVKVGVKSWIGPYVILDGSGGGINIGSYCSISAGVHIYTHDSVMWALSGGQQSLHQSPVIINDCTYIGAQSVIKAGVSIGAHCVIGAHSFVNCDVPERTIVAGSPARPIGRIIIEQEEIRLEYDHKKRSVDT